jgi:uncharacterized coiled-coil protein SlyX
MEIILKEADYQKLKAKADLFDSQKKGHIELHYSHIHECIETAVYGGDKAIEHLNEVIKYKQKQIKHKQKKINYWIDKYYELEKKKNVNFISLLYQRALILFGIKK